MDSYTHQKSGKNPPLPTWIYQPKPQNRYDYFNMFFFYSSDLYHLGNWFKLYQWSNVIFHRSTLGSQAATYFGRCPGWFFFVPLPKGGNFVGFFSLVFLFLIEIIVRPKAKHLHQTSRTKKWQLSALLLLDAINGFNFKYEQYIRFYLLQPCIVRRKPWRLFLKCIKHVPKWTKYLR